MTEFKITEGRKCTDCKYYIYKEDTEWHDMCSHGNKGLFECVIDEAESCRGYISTEGTGERMTEVQTIKKIRNKARAKKLKDRKKQEYRKRNDGIVVPIPFDVFLEKIQGIDHETVVRVMSKR